MLSILKNKTIAKCLLNFTRNYSERNGMKVAIIGAAGKISHFVNNNNDKLSNNYNN